MAKPSQQIARGIDTFTPNQRLMIGAGGGALTGAGIAALCEMTRHAEPTGVGLLLYTVAGALVGGGAGTLAGARTIEIQAEASLPGLKLKARTV